MPGDTCVVYENSRAKGPGVSFHRFPADPACREMLLHVFQTVQTQVKPHTRVCCRHFPRADVKRDPHMDLGKRFASPKKKGTPRTKRAAGSAGKRWKETLRPLARLFSHTTRVSPSILQAGSSRSNSNRSSSFFHLHTLQ